MRLPLRTAFVDPIAIDFGWSSTKVLQCARSKVLAAGQIAVDPDTAADLDARLATVRDAIPKLLRDGGFVGNTVVMALPAHHTMLRTLQLDHDEHAEAAMMVQLPDTSEAWMVRTIEIDRPAASKREVICQAVPRSVVLKHVELLHALKLEVVAVTSQAGPIVAAFDHIHRRTSDGATATMYVDMGAGSTRVVIAHGRQVVQARSVAVGGQHFDDRVADVMQCSHAEARAHRLLGDVPVMEGHADAEDAAWPAMLSFERRVGAPTPSLGPDLDGLPVQAATVDVSVLLETLADELRLCLRQHAATWPHVDLNRVVFTGGEARQPWLCRDLVRAVSLPGQIGDPLAALEHADQLTSPDDWSDRPRPDWSLCVGMSALHSNEDAQKGRSKALLASLARAVTARGFAHAH